ncbi:hypothetical protein BGX38DRAFT_1143554 [Terfezia claveryi]|nr:hypothetical protein BGX38DRAFT_1143554 [Terfezia claveryi]
MEDFKAFAIPIPTTSRVRFERHRCASRPRLPDSLKPTPTLTPTPIVSLTTARVAGLLSSSDLQDRQRLDELQSNLRTHSEHKKKVFNYLVTVKSKRQEEEGGEFDITEGDVTENAIAGNMLDVLDTLDELLSGADQRLMENGAKAKGPMMETVTDEYGEMVGDIKIRNPLPESLQNKMEEECTSKSEHGVSVKRTFKLPAWKAMMDEVTPPGSPFSRDLFAKDHVEGEPVMNLVPDHLVTNDKEVKANAGTFEPRMTSSAAVKAMFERFLGPSKAVETARLAKAEGKAQLKAGKVTGKGSDLVPPVPPRIVRRRQQRQKEDGAREAQAVAVKSQPAQSKPPFHFNVLYSRSSCTNKHSAKAESSGSPTDRGRERSVSTFRKATPPMIHLEETDYDYYRDFLHQGVKAKPGKPLYPVPTMCSDATLRKARSWSGSSSLPGLELACDSLYVEPNTSTSSSVISRNGSEDAQADTSASSVPSTGSQPGKTSPVAAMIPNAEFKTGGGRERYKPTSNVATLNVSHQTGVAFTETETLQGIPRKGEQAVRDEAGRNQKRHSATSEEPNDDTPMDDQVEIENVKPYPLLRRKDPFTTPKKNVFESDEDGGSVYSRPTGFTNTQGFRPMDSLEDEEDHWDVSTGSPSLRRTQQIRRGSRRTSVPNSAVGRNSAGRDANWGEAMKTSPASTTSSTSRIPKELRMLGLTMEELFLDPISGDFIEPDRSIGGTAELRRKYEIEGREAWKHGELSMVTLQNVLKEREKERSLTEAMFSESTKRMPPPKSKLPKGGKKTSRIGHRQHSTPASIASTLFSLSRKASEASVSSFQPPKKRVPTPSLASNETDRTSGISAGMRRIFAGSFGSKSSDSVMTKRSIDKSMICVIGGRTLSGAPSMMSDRASGESFLPAASVTSSTRSSMTKSICGSVGPLFSRQSSTAAAAHEKDGNKTAKPSPAKIEPRKLPSPPPKLARHATAPYGNTIKAPITRTEAKERKASVFDFPIPPNVDHYACSLDESASVPAIQLSPPVTASAKLFGYNPHNKPTLSRLPTPAHPVALKRPQTGAGSRPMSRANSRAGSRSNSRLSQRTTSRNSLAGIGRHGSVNSLTAGGRRGSVSSILTINRPTSRAASRAGAISRAGATSRVGGITRQKGVANLRTLENRQHRPQASAAPKMGALLGGESAGSRAGSRLGSYDDERAASRIGSTSRMMPTPKMAPIIRPASRSAGLGFSRVQTKSDRPQATPKPGSYHDSRDESQTSTYADNDQAESGDYTFREWLTRDIPLGSRLPAPHLMSSPGGRYPKPMGTVVGGGRNGKRGPGLLSGSGRSSPAVQRVGRGREDRGAQGKQQGKNGNGKRGGDA